MGFTASADRVLIAPLRRWWGSHRHQVPQPVVSLVQGPVKSGLRAVGLAHVAPAGPRGAPSLAIRSTWPGIAEHRDHLLRGLVFEELLGPGEGRTYLDLGAGPCQFARRARDLGWTVTAVDGRTERLPDDLADITFIEADVRGFDTTGYDTISILGLLYHLTLPEQEALLRSCNASRVILETQIHTPGYVPPAAEPWGRRIVKVDGLEGVVFPEGDNPMASLGTPTSFWVTEAGLLTLVERCGYRKVEVVEPAHHSKYGTRKFYVLEA